MGNLTRLADLLSQGNDLEDALRMVDALGSLTLKDGITAPPTPSNNAVIYIDSADGDLKVKFSDGTITVIAADT